MMAVGKRLSASDPLNEHDIAERLDRAAFRTLRILMDVREHGVMDAVKGSRYNTNVLSLLVDELAEWGYLPKQEALDPEAVAALNASTDVERF